MRFDSRRISLKGGNQKGGIYSIIIILVREDKCFV